MSLICNSRPVRTVVLAMSLLTAFAGGRAFGEAPPALAESPFDARTARHQQDRWANYLGQPVEFHNSLGMTLMLIPPGEFLMGSTDVERQWAKIQARFRLSGDTSLKEAIASIENEAPQHLVRITRPFYVSAHEVTVGQFRRFVRATGHETESERRGTGTRGWDDSKGAIVDPKYSWRNPGFSQDDTHPVVSVSWNDAIEFCRWLSQQERREYRLPTEAEWEYACRAGTTTRFYHGDDPEGVAAVAHVEDGTFRDQFPHLLCTISTRDGYIFTAAVGRFKPNGFGLFDMHGNVWEWCADWYRADYYEKSPPEDPPGPTAGVLRVGRGGAWCMGLWYCRSAHRMPFSPNYASFMLGFRIALVPPDVRDGQATEAARVTSDELRP